MKKILATVLIILLLVLAYFTIFEGISIGSNFRILSANQIVQSNDTLTNKITQANSLLKKDYISKKSELQEAVTGTDGLLEEKKKYFNLAKISTTGELAKAATEDKFTNDFLWTTLGRYATSRGVILEMHTKSAGLGDDEIQNIDFIVTGQCPAIADFLYAIEGDSDLNFRISDFNLVPNDSNSSLVATFSVNNVRIKKEDVSKTVGTSGGNTSGAQSSSDTQTPEGAS